MLRNNIKKWCLCGTLGLLGPLFIFTFLSLGFLTLCRIALTLGFSLNDLSAYEFFYILLQGVRVDFASVCALYGLPALILVTLNLLKLKPKLVLKIIAIFLALGFTFLVLNEAASPAFIKEYGVRPNHLYVQYLIYPKEVFSMILSAHKLEAIFAIVTTALAFILSFNFCKKLFLKATYADFVFPKRMISALSLILIVAIIPLGIRSTLGHRPLNPAMVAFSSNLLKNSLPLNSSYSAIYAVLHLDDKLSQDEIYKIVSAKEVEGILDELSTRNPKDNNLSPLNQEINPYASKKHNVVIVLEESLGANFVESLGGLPLTPNLEALKKDGLWFENMYAAGHRSIRGIEAVSAGFPPSPLESIVKLTPKVKSYATVAQVFKQQGYDTSFIYGGESHFDNMRSYFLANGIDHVVEQKDYDNPSFVASWGVSDEDLFKRAQQHYERLFKEGKPFFSIVFSTSFHDPFDIPQGKVKLPSAIKTDEARRLAAVMYADFALGEFFKLAKSSSYYQDTVFLVVADHESRVRGQGNFPLAKFKIPALLISPDLKPQVDRRLVSQIDLAPTLISLANCHVIIPMAGQNLLQKNIKERAFMQFNESFGYFDGSHLTVLTPGHEADYFKVTFKTPRIVSLKEENIDDETLDFVTKVLNLGPSIHEEHWQNVKYLQILN